MGCGKSSAAKADDSQTQVKDIRRRLSVGHVDEGQDDATNTEATEEDRGLITSLAQETVIEMLSKGGQDGDRKFSIGSNTDMSKTSFANKTMQQIGDEVDPAANGLGFTCRKGLKPESPNQDSWSVLKVDGNFSIYGVYDGHGKLGHDVSNFVKENLPKLIIRDQRFKTDQMEPMLMDSFKKMQSLISTSDRLKKLSAQMSGTTATVVIHDHNENKITVSHVADSSCVRRYSDATRTDVGGFALTTDNEPDLPKEKVRIEKARGRLVFDGYANHHVYAKNARYPGLNMSSCSEKEL
eukprot:gnl/TRDRNA2_/TRDRNA2_176555_c0_seq6.p1 gnl/TRDRNA2_/TRDRNA2_176555_c0~~gnl/TRDRNA2_/TRDRNA2_176555_c0_seq6.p1  ORF type:complete len:296 (+),score=57.14 gnl/TRDRNA2_/TRDRNA2_176555_c0_seq6:93-980(+)